MPQHTEVGGNCSNTERISISLVPCCIGTEFTVTTPTMVFFVVEGKCEIYHMGQRAGWIWEIFRRVYNPAGATGNVIHTVCVNCACRVCLIL